MLYINSAERYVRFWLGNGERTTQAVTQTSLRGVVVPPEVRAYDFVVFESYRGESGELIWIKPSDAGLDTTFYVGWGFDRWQLPRDLSLTELETVANTPITHWVRLEVGGIKPLYRYDYVTTPEQLRRMIAA